MMAVISGVLSRFMGSPSGPVKPKGTLFVTERANADQFECPPIQGPAFNPLTAYSLAQHATVVSRMSLPPAHAALSPVHVRLH